MKKMLVLLFVFTAISASVHAALIQFNVTVASTEGVGVVSVQNATTNTPPVNCTGTTPCTFTFKTGTKVHINAGSNSVNFAFQNWVNPTGGSAAPCLNTNSSCAFTITQNSSVTANIDPTFNLQVQVGTGSGSVRVKTLGATFIDCTNTAPLSCSKRFVTGSQITIENIAGPNQKFGGYTNKTGIAAAPGACTANPCHFRLTADSSLVSNFIPLP